MRWNFWKTTTPYVQRSLTQQNPSTSLFQSQNTSNASSPKSNHNTNEPLPLLARSAPNTTTSLTLKISVQKRRHDLRRRAFKWESRRSPKERFLSSVRRDSTHIDAYRAASDGAWHWFEWRIFCIASATGLYLGYKDPLEYSGWPSLCLWWLRLHGHDCIDCLAFCIAFCLETMSISPFHFLLSAFPCFCILFNYTKSSLWF